MAQAYLEDHQFATKAACGPASTGHVSVAQFFHRVDRAAKSELSRKPEKQNRVISQAAATPRGTAGLQRDHSGFGKARPTKALVSGQFTAGSSLAVTWTSRKTGRSAPTNPHRPHPRRDDMKPPENLYSAAFKREATEYTVLSN